MTTEGWITPSHVSRNSYGGEEKKGLEKRLRQETSSSPVMKELDKLLVECDALEKESSLSSPRLADLVVANTRNNREESIRTSAPSPKQLQVALRNVEHRRKNILRLRDRALASTRDVVSRLETEAHERERGLESREAHYEQLYASALSEVVCLEEDLAEEVRRRQPLEELADSFESIFSDLHVRQTQYISDLRVRENDRMRGEVQKVKDEYHERLERLQATHLATIMRMQSEHVETLGELRQARSSEMRYSSRAEKLGHLCADREEAISRIRNEATRLREALEIELLDS